MRLLLEDGSLLLLENGTDALLLESDYIHGYKRKRRYIVTSTVDSDLEKIFGIDIGDSLDSLLNNTIVHMD